ncbi:MAG: PadR family transcriptional regulator [Nocardioidaceae bacterium]
MAERMPSNMLALAVLSCLSERPMHPYEISQTLRYRGKDQSIKLNYGALYGVVEKLASGGLIEARETVRQGRRPERTVYAITEAGVAKHEGWLSELIRTPKREYAALEAGLALVAGLAPDVVAGLLEERTVRLRLEVASAEEALRITEDLGIPEIFSIEGELRRALLKAELDFVTDLVDRIRSGRLGGLRGWRKVHELLDEGVTFEQIFGDPVRYLGEDAPTFLPDTTGGG